MIAQQQKSFYMLEEIGDRELPDAVPDAPRRRHLKALARRLRLRYSARELMYLAGAVEEQARLDAR